MFCSTCGILLISLSPPYLYVVYVLRGLVVLFVSFLFQGGKIRSKLVDQLRGADGVSIEEGTSGEGGKEAAQNGMRK